MDRLGKIHNLLNRKFYNYESVLLRIKDENDQVLS